MRVAKKIYAGIDVGGQRVGLTTCTRTDSVTVPKSAMWGVCGIVRSHSGKPYQPGRPWHSGSGHAMASKSKAIGSTDFLRLSMIVKKSADLKVHAGIKAADPVLIS